MIWRVCWLSVAVPSSVHKFMLHSFFLTAEEQNMAKENCIFKLHRTGGKYIFAFHLFKYLALVLELMQCYIHITMLT